MLVVSQNLKTGLEMLFVAGKAMMGCWAASCRRQLLLQPRPVAGRASQMECARTGLAPMDS